jgi:nucleoid-associated protein YgaU
MTDPLQMLLAQQAATDRFPQNSRYHGIGTAARLMPDGRPVVYLQRRFPPMPSSLALIREHTVRAGDRLDNLAAAHLGDPELYWRICDANGALRPDALTAQEGRVLRIALPEGTPGGMHG